MQNSSCCCRDAATGSREEQGLLGEHATEGIEDPRDAGALRDRRQRRGIACPNAPALRFAAIAPGFGEGRASCCSQEPPSRHRRTHRRAAARTASTGSWGRRLPPGAARRPASAHHRRRQLQDRHRAFRPQPQTQAGGRGVLHRHRCGGRGQCLGNACAATSARGRSPRRNLRLRSRPAGKARRTVCAAASALA